MNRAWFNGRLIDGPLPLDRSDRGLLLGDGVFETILVANGRAIWLDAHLARMGDAARELGLGFDQPQVEAAAAQVLAPCETGVLRLTLTRGPAPGGLQADGTQPSLLATLAPLPAEAMFQPVRLATSTIRRNEYAPASRLKTLSYADAIVAARQASLLGAGDALMLNTAGLAASSTIANLFLLTGRQLVTPSPGQGILPGITRRTLLDLAAQLCLEPVERPVHADELTKAEAVFLTNSLRLVRPVTALDGRATGTRSLAAIAEALADVVRQESQSTFPQNPLVSTAR